MHRAAFILATLLALTSGCQSRPVAETARPTNAMAATAHPLATEAAREILGRGGNAVDAAVAAIAFVGLAVSATGLD